MQITNATASQALSSRRNLHFHLCFGGQGGDVGPVPCSLCQLGNARGGVFRPFTFLGQGEQPAITKGLFSGPKKVRKIGNVTAGLLSSRFGAVDDGCMKIDFADMGPATLQHICAREGAQKRTRQEEPLLIPRGSTFGSLLK